MGLVISEQKLAQELGKEFKQYAKNAAESILLGVLSSYRVDVDLQVGNLRIAGSLKLERKDGTP